MAVHCCHHRGEGLRPRKCSGGSLQTLAEPVATIPASGEASTGIPASRSVATYRRGGPIGHPKATREIGRRDPGSALDELQRHQGAGGR